MRRTASLVCTALTIISLSLLAVGCGGGGESVSSSGGGTTTGVTPGLPAGYGVISLTFHQAGASGPEVEGPPRLGPVVIPASTLPTPTHARVAVRMVKTEQLQAYDENNNPIPGEFYTVTHEVYRFVEDYDLAVITTANIAVPAADGYTVEVVSYYNNADGTHNLLKYGKSAAPVNVLAGETNSSVAVNTSQIAQGLAIVLPDNVVGGSLYSVSVDKSALPLYSQYYFQQFVDNVTNLPPDANFVDATSPLFKDGNVKLRAQALTTAGPTNTYWDLYFQGMFFLSDTWLKDATLGSNATEAKTDWKKWKFYYPNLDYPTPDDPSAMSTQLWPLGTITIGVNL